MDMCVCRELLQIYLPLLNGACSQWSTLCRAPDRKPATSSVPDGVLQTTSPVTCPHNTTSTMTLGRPLKPVAGVVNLESWGSSLDSGKGTASSPGKLSTASSIDSSLYDAASPYNHKSRTALHRVVVAHSSASDSMPNLKRALQAPPSLNFAQNNPQPAAGNHFGPTIQSPVIITTQHHHSLSVRQKHATIASLLERKNSPSCAQQQHGLKTEPTLLERTSSWSSEVTPSQKCLLNYSPRCSAFSTPRKSPSAPKPTGSSELLQRPLATHAVSLSSATTHRQNCHFQNGNNNNVSTSASNFSSTESLVEDLCLKKSPLGSFGAGVSPRQASLAMSPKRRRLSGCFGEDCEQQQPLNLSKKQQPALMLTH